MANHFRLLRMKDASNPEGLNLNTNGVSVVAGYIGGDTPHVWSEADWRRFPGVKKLPIFVRSQVVGLNGGKADGFLALEALYRLGVPKNTLVIYDRETNTDAEATHGFGEVLQWVGYKVATYGSRDNLFSHPSLNGYWVADPTGSPHMYDHPGVNITQYAIGNGFDYSEAKFWTVETEMKVWA